MILANHCTRLGRCVAIKFLLFLLIIVPWQVSSKSAFFLPPSLVPPASSTSKGVTSSRVLGGAAACRRGCVCLASASTSHGRALLCPGNCASIEINKNSSTSLLVRVFLFAIVHGVEVASRPNSPANGAAAEFIGLGDETGHEGNIVDDGEEQNDENVGGFMRKSNMTSKTEDDCSAQTRLHAVSTWATRMRSYVWSVHWEKCARLVRCAIFSPRRFLGGSPFKRETVKILWSEKDCSKNARTITFVLHLIRSFIDGMLIFVSTNLVLPRVVRAIRSMVVVQSMNPTMRRSWISLIISSG